MSVAQPHIRAVAKNNPNHYKQGRFASADEEGFTSEEGDEERYDGAISDFDKHIDAANHIRTEVAHHVNALKDAKRRLGAAYQGASDAHDKINDVAAVQCFAP